MGDTERHEIEQEEEPVKPGNIHTQMVDVKNTVTDDIILRNDESGELEKYSVKYHKIPWRKSMEIIRKVWNESDKDQTMFAYLVQIHELEEMIDEINGVECNKTFWNNIRHDFVEAIRQTVFGDSPLLPAVDMEQLKNLTGVLRELGLTGNAISPELEAILKKVTTQHPQNGSMNSETQ